jgi:hypothetical protein
MRRLALTITIALFYVLHQDFWFWNTAHPLAFGFLPVGLLYHGCYTLAAALLMALLVKSAWPKEFDDL